MVSHICDLAAETYVLYSWINPSLDTKETLIVFRKTIYYVINCIKSSGILVLKNIHGNVLIWQDGAANFLN